MLKIFPMAFLLMFLLAGCEMTGLKKASKVAIVGATAFSVASPPVAFVITAVDTLSEVLISPGPAVKEIKTKLDAFVFSFEKTIDGLIFLFIVVLVLRYVVKPFMLYFIRKLKSESE